MKSKGTSLQTAETFKARRVIHARFEYILTRPPGTPPKSGWPFILFLHGSGERGSRLSTVERHGIPKVAKQIPEFPFLTISPQCPARESWETNDLLALLDYASKEYPIDRRRVYLTGLSMGGYGVWSLAIAQPGRFAAIAPICGGGDSAAVELAGRSRLRSLKTLPIWSFHGALDDLVKPSESERMIGAFRRIGNSAKLTIYPTAGHDSWTETYNNPELYSWFLSHRRRGGK